MNRFGLFQVGALAYAVPLGRLRRIVHYPRRFALPKLPQGVISVVVEEGRLVPLLNLFVLLTGQGAVTEASEYLVLAESEAGTVALPADRTCGIIPEGRGQLQSGAESGLSVRAGEFTYRQKTFVSLDIDMLTISLVQAPRQAAGSSRGAGRHQ